MCVERGEGVDEIGSMYSMEKYKECLSPLETCKQ